MSFDKPLSGVRIVDLTWVLSGPFASMLLADLGAEVIKVEPPEGDTSRTVPPFYEHDRNPFFYSVNRNKKSISLNLKKPHGRRAFDSLCEQSDVVINNFSPKAARKLGLTYSSLKDINPRLVSTSIFGFDKNEPYSAMPAFDSVIQAVGGVMGITGEPGNPSRVGYQIGDLAGGLYAAIGTLAALHKRSHTGVGSDVDISLFDAQLSLLTWQGQDHLLSGNVPQALGTRHPMLVPNQAFKTLDGESIVVSATGDSFWRRFCQALDRPDIAADSRFSSASKRLENRDILENLLDNIFLEKSSSDWLERLEANRVPATRVLSVGEALSHPVVDIRNMRPTVEDKYGDKVPIIGNPIKVGDQGDSFVAPPDFGQDTQSVLSDVLGYSSSSIAEVFDE